MSKKLSHWLVLGGFKYHHLGVRDAAQSTCHLGSNNYIKRPSHLNSVLNIKPFLVYPYYPGFIFLCSIDKFVYV